MIKVSTFLAESEFGLSVIPLFGPADAEFEKNASADLLPEVLQYISELRPRNDAQYVLVNAMGAGEFYGSNINGDHFPENGLIHKPDSWRGVPLLDKTAAKDWPYGFPTFYGAHPFAHHRNKDPSRAYGEVEFATWNDKMKRVELVTRVDKDKCFRFGGVGVWDKLRDGQFPDVSMGSKVPFDTCSICLDWKLYHEALATFDPKKHRHPGAAALEFHKRLKAKNGVGIRGLSITRKDYCEHALRSMNKIFPDGRKVFVYNDFPRFFDISFVFIGADRTAKVMVFIVRAGQKFSMPSAEAAEHLGISDHDVPDKGEKRASVEDEILKSAFSKGAENKKAAIEKDVVPSQFAGKAIPVLTKNEPDLPKELLEALSSVPLKKALSTTSGMGIVLRPREFQRVMLTGEGKGDLADKLEQAGVMFPSTDEATPMGMSPDNFMPALARLLAPMMGMRSGLGPIIERRVTIVCTSPKKEASDTSSLSSDLLRKIGSAYNGYRRGVMEVVASTQSLLEKAATSKDADMHKLAGAATEELFTPLAHQYLSGAFKDEVPQLAVPAEGMVVSSPGSCRREEGNTLE